jgi:hypothetical protein
MRGTVRSELPDVGVGVWRTHVYTLVVPQCRSCSRSSTDTPLVAGRDGDPAGVWQIDTRRRKPSGRMLWLQVQPRHLQEGPETVDSHQAITFAAQSGQTHHTPGRLSRHAPSPTNLARIVSALDRYLRTPHDCMRRALLKPWTPCLLPRRAPTSPRKAPPRRSCSPRRARTASR